MTDNTSSIAGDYPGGIRITCILNEGNPTVTATSYDEMGRSAKGLAWADELEEGNLVAICNTTDVTYAACGGLPCVEKAVTTEALVIGMIVSTPKLQTFPSTSALANTLALRLASDYYRTAVVEIWGGITKVISATVKDVSGNAVVPGIATYLNYSITEGYAEDGIVELETTTGNGVGLIPLHYMAATGSGDTATVLLGITGMMYAVTGT